ncbi:MAG: TolC family protein [Lentisphaeria bacterium]|nr:TolC family protein [Lentisphaeria bacterium]
MMVFNDIILENLKKGLTSWFALSLIFTTACTTTEDKIESADIKTHEVTTNSKVKQQEKVLTLKKLELKDFLHYAYQHNPDLASKEFRVSAARERVSQVNTLPDPRITYGYFFEEVQTRTGPQEQTLGVSQTFPWFGKLSLKEKQQIYEIDIAQEHYIDTKLAIGEKVSKSFYEYIYLKESLIISQDHLDLLKLFEDTVNARVETAEATQADLLQLQIESSQIKDRILQMKSLRNVLSSKLLNTIGTDEKGIIPWPTHERNLLSPTDYKEIVPMLDELNPKLRRLDLLKQKEEVTLEVKDKDYYPDITLGLETIDVDGGDNPVRGTVSFNIPIWRSKLDAAKRESELEIESLNREAENLRNMLYADIEYKIFQYNDALRKQKLYKDELIPKAEQTMELILTSYKTGEKSFDEVYDVINKLLDFKLAETREYTNAEVYNAGLIRLIGFQHRYLEVSHEQN